MAPGPACSEKSNLGRDPRCGALLTAQTFLCTVAGGCRQLAQLLLKLPGGGECAWSGLGSPGSGKVRSCAGRSSLMPAGSQTECPWAQELLPVPMPSFPTGLLGSLLQGQESRIIHIHAGSVSPGVSVPTMKGLNQEYPSISMVARLTQEYPYP